MRLSIDGEWTAPCLCQFLGIALALGAAGGLASSIIGANAATDAANTQAAASTNASNNALTASSAAAGRLQPFANLGLGAGADLSLLTGTAPGTSPVTAPLTAPFSPADLTNTPGYQFTLQQGLQATQNSYAAQGLGRSGAALKGAAGYATGLASTTYNQQLQNYLTQNQQVYNMLMGQTQVGANAAAGAGTFGVQGTAASNAFLTGGAAATAAGQVGSANAFSGGINNLGSNALLFSLLKNNPNVTGQTSSGASANSTGGTS